MKSDRLSIDAFFAQVHDNISDGDALIDQVVARLGISDPRNYYRNVRVVGRHLVGTIHGEGEHGEETSVIICEV